MVKRNIFKKFACAALSFCIMAGVVNGNPDVRANASSNDDGIPSIYILHNSYNPYFVQKVYLEPETEYVFSYLYSNLPASEEALCYTQSGRGFSSEERVFSSDENRILKTFTTVSLDADGVTEGSGANAGKIESYIGIRMYGLKADINCDDSDYTNGKCLYGGFELYKKSDSSKNNLFVDLQFDDIATSSGGGKWTSLPVNSGNYAQRNFARYDADPNLSGRQNPSAEVFACPYSDITLLLGDVSQTSGFVQEVWLKPNTEYTFSYLYSKAPASSEIISKSLSGGGLSVLSKQEDARHKRVLCNFKTPLLTDSGVTVGTGTNSGLVSVTVGLKFNAEDTVLSGGYYADLRLYRTADTVKENLFADKRYSKIGKLSDGAAWHGLSVSVDASETLQKASVVSKDAFERVYTIHAAEVSGGTITLSRNSAREGDSVTVTLTPDENYTLANNSVKANDIQLWPNNGKCTFSCPAEDVTVTALFETGEEIPAISVLHTRYSPYFVQKVYLEPETEYVFSYLYSNLPASAEATYYTESGKSFQTGDRVYSQDENRISRTFKTSSADTDGVVVGTGDNAGKIESYIGIRMYGIGNGLSSDNPQFTDGKCLYGGFMLYKKSDSSKQNLFGDLSFNDIGTSGGGGKWTSLPQNSGNFAQLNFARYDADLQTSGRQHPKASTFAKERTYPSVEVKGVTDNIKSYLVQSVWLKPNTTYVYSLMYSSNEPPTVVILKNTSEKKYDTTTPVYDKEFNKVTYEFTTKNSSDSDTVYDSTTGKVQALVGVRVYTTRSDLKGQYFADFKLYEKSDSNENNSLTDTDFTSIGISGKNTWNGLYGSVYANDSFKSGGSVSEYSFKKNRTVSVSATASGTLRLSRTSAKSGDTVYFHAVPAKGKWLSGYKIGNGSVVKTLGKNFALTVRSSDITVYPIFSDVLKADCGGDGSVNITDLVRLNNYLNGEDIDVVFENSDCNADGAVNADDFEFARLSVLGIPYGIEMLEITGGKVNTSLSGGADLQASELRNAIRRASDSIKRTGTVYYVSQNGNDANAGTSTAKPIKTVDKLSSLSLKSGDTVLFERGSTFRTSGTYSCVAGVKYGAYGTGDKPKIYGSSQDYATAVWSKTEYPNVYKTSLKKVNPLNGDVGIIVFDNNTAVGTKQCSIEALFEDGYFYYDYDEQSVYLYCSKGNPSSVYGNIEIGRKMNMFIPASGVTIDNIGFFYTGAHALAAGQGTNNVTITNCEVGFVGGSYHMNTRYGNGIQFWNGCQNIEISNCYIYQVFDAAITFQGDDETSVYKNITFKNNLIEFCSWSVEWWNGYENPNYAVSWCDIGEISNVSIESNIMRFEGCGWARATRTPASIHGPWAVRNFKNFSDFTVSDNIFDCPNGEFVLWRQSKSLSPQQGYSMTGNTYYHKNTEDNVVFFLGTGGETVARNQSELEAAVNKFDSNPKDIGWLE